eukprot:5090431-Prymnesium_polylepis.1
MWQCGSREERKASSRCTRLLARSDAAPYAPLRPRHRGTRHGTHRGTRRPPARPPALPARAARRARSALPWTRGRCVSHSRASRTVCPAARATPRERRLSHKRGCQGFCARKGHLAAGKVFVKLAVVLVAALGPSQLAAEWLAVLHLSNKEITTGVLIPAFAVHHTRRPLSSVAAAVGIKARAATVPKVSEELALILLRATVQRMARRLHGALRSQRRPQWRTAITTPAAKSQGAQTAKAAAGSGLFAIFGRRGPSGYLEVENAL